MPTVNPLNACRVSQEKYDTYMPMTSKEFNIVYRSLLLPSRNPKLTELEALELRRVALTAMLEVTRTLVKSAKHAAFDNSQYWRSKNIAMLVKLEITCEYIEATYGIAYLPE